MFEHFLNAFATLFVTIDPIGTVPIYLALVVHMGAKIQRAVALRSSLIALIILLTFAFVGEPFKLSGRIAGGLADCWRHSVVHGGAGYGV